ncbi:MAG: S8 family serine peptidase, partial [Burkholderiales bacterium]
MKKYPAIFGFASIGFAIGSLFGPIGAHAAPGGFMLKNFRALSVTAPKTDRIVVKLHSMQPAFMVREIKADKIHNLSAAAGVELAMQRPISGGAHVLKLPKKMAEAEVQTYVNALRAHPDVIYAEVDRVRRAERVPNDPDYAGRSVLLGGPNNTTIPHNSEQWYLKTTPAGISAPAAWDITTGDASIRVAVVDTGIAPHSEMAGRSSGGYDFISDTPSANDGNGRDPDPSDPGDWVTTADTTNPIYASCGFTSDDVTDSSWHGISVAGIIGAASNNGIGIAGINWVSQILPLRVLGKCGG